MKRRNIISIGFGKKGGGSSTPNIFTPINLYYTNRELSFLQSRNTFVTDDDYTTNSKGERDIIEGRADSFLVNYVSQRFFPNPEVPAGQEIQPNELDVPDTEDYEMPDCAYWYFLFQGSVYGNIVKSELLVHARNFTLDFSDDTRWAIGGLGQGSVFNIAVWLHKIFLSYTFTRNLFSDAEKTEMDRWFFWIADYFQRRNIDYAINRFFVDRPNGDYTLSAYGNSQGMNDIVGYTHYFGDGTAGNAVRYWHFSLGNNRRWSMAYLFGVISFHLEYWSSNSLTPSNINQSNTLITFTTQPQIDNAIAQFYTSVDLFAHEFIKFCMYPDGAVSDMYRWSDAPTFDEHESGMGYGFDALICVLRIGDLQKRHGLTSIWDYSTTEGIYNSTDGVTEKSIRLSVHTFCKLQRHELTWYGSATTFTEGFRLDFRNPNATNYKQWTTIYCILPFSQYIASFDVNFALYLIETYMFQYGTPFEFFQRGLNGAFLFPQMGPHGLFIAGFFDKSLTEFDRDLNPYLGTFS
jgi:hypothetical protein